MSFFIIVPEEKIHACAKKPELSCGKAEMRNLGMAGEGRTFGGSSLMRERESSSGSSWFKTFLDTPSVDWRLFVLLMSDLTCQPLK